LENRKGEKIMHKKIAILILITLCCAAYAGDLAKFHSQLEPSKRAFSPDSKSLADAARGHGITEIAVERGGGGGKFQVSRYQCVLKSDGTAVFTREAGSTPAGVRTGKVHPDVYNKLAYFISQTDLTKYANSYGGGVEEGQGVVYISAVKNGERKTIMDSGHYAPAQIWAIEELIDHVRTTSVQWDPPQLLPVPPAADSTPTTGTLQQ
jgi:hypothetical protein